MLLERDGASNDHQEGLGDGGDHGAEPIGRVSGGQQGLRRQAPVGTGTTLPSNLVNSCATASCRLVLDPINRGSVMRSHVSRWGNGIAIRIPADVSREMGVHAGDGVDIRVESGGLLITPVAPACPTL